MENGGLGPISEAHIIDRIRVMEQQGLVNHVLRNIYTLKAENGPQFFETLLSSVLMNVSRAFDSMFGVLKANVVDFAELCENAIKLEGCVGCLGAIRMRETCTNLHSACDDKSKDWCLQAFGEIVCEYEALRTHLDILLKLEQDLLASQTNYGRQGNSPGAVVPWAV